MKGISKEACRQFLEPLAVPKSDCGLFLIKALKYIIRTTVKIVGHRRVLVLCLYTKGDAPGDKPKLAYTMFQASDSFITYDHDPDRKTPWRTAMLDNLGCKYQFAEKHCAFYSRMDEQRVLDFCKDHSGNGAWVLGIYQKRIRDQETQLRVRRRQKKIAEEFRDLRPLPKGVNSWLCRDVLPAYFFYDYRKGAKRTPGICSACGQKAVLEGVRHNAEGVCPRCGRKLTMKSNKKCGRIWDRETASVVQRLRENELVVRILKVSRFQRGGHDVEQRIYEKTRVIVRQNGDGRFWPVPYHHDSRDVILMPWKKGYPPVMYLFGVNFNAETCGYLYCGNLERELKGTPWQYCQLAAFYKGIQKQIEVAPYLITYREIPAIEYFVKLGLHWLAAQIVYRGNNSSREQILDLNGKNLRQILQIDPAHLRWLKRPGAGLRDLFLLRILRKEGHKPDGELFAWLDDHHITDIAWFEQVLPYTTPHKLTRYLGEQFRKIDPDSYSGISDTLSDYKDYLRFCKELNYDMRNEFVLFPKNLKVAHDQANNQLKCKRVETYDPKIEIQRDNLKRQYHFKAKGLVVLPPCSAQEIVTEGHKLHHCVGSYVQDMADQKSAILFIRHEKQKDKPFYTVEVKGDRIIQTRGKNNCAPTPEVKDFLEAWKKKKHLRTAA